MSHLIVFILLWSELPCCLAFIRVRRDEPYVIYLIVASGIIMILSVIYFCLSCRRPVDSDLEYGDTRKRKNVGSNGGGIAYPQIKKVPSGYIQMADGSRVTLALETKSSIRTNNNSNINNNNGEWTGQACNESISSWFPSVESSYAPSIKQHWDGMIATTEQHDNVSTKSMEDHKPSTLTETNENTLLRVPPPVKRKSTR
ncbi:hypothetical protein BDF22DRAFT_656995 [Syncephalis plumigaleata]|nr:hypothetical protein BDF22DRAFT_656995 [Syncephalis plumigaleata]